jgi:enoyl-CoA hydratase
VIEHFHESRIADEVLVSYRPGVAVITINRPHAKNAVTRAVSEGVASALDELDRRDDLAVAVITGAGGSFCAGMDLKGFLRGERPSIEGRGFAGLTEAPPKKPLIAAVEGYALAGGCEIVLACDLVIAARGAKFGIPEVKRGLVAAAGGLMRLPHRIPRLEAPAELAGTVSRHAAAPDRSDAPGPLAGIGQDGPLAVRAGHDINYIAFGHSQHDVDTLISDGVVQ